jgi:hypothetical protein
VKFDEADPGTGIGIELRGLKNVSLAQGPGSRRPRHRQASRVGLGGHGWGATGWFVVAAWTVVAVAAARRAYARDTQRV